LPLAGAPDRGTVRIGIARDTAFSFVYPANLDLLRAMGLSKRPPYGPLSPLVYSQL
jgi:cobyrinic acid a,c-diamide synthase